MNQTSSVVKKPAATGGRYSTDGKMNWKSRIVQEAKQFLRLFLYLYVMLGMFLLHESVVLARYHIPFTRFGFGLVTAAVLAKVMLVMEDFNIVRGFEGRPVIYSIVWKSTVYAVIFIIFYTAEETVGGLLRGETLRASVPSIAGGTPQGMLIAEVITSLALVPYFAFRELGKILGEAELHALLFKRRPNPGGSD